LNSERINSKVNAIAVIEAARSKQFPTEIPHDGLVTGLKGNFAGAGPYMDADYSDDETG
jgi:hypothetical protein